jgi:hypothetical protein
VASEDTAQIVKNCEDSLIQVLNITVSCDSPYTFYYGNGANRNSPVCNYGDKVKVTVSFDVQEYVDSTIYMQMSAYTGADEQLYLGDSVDVCDYVGSSCNFRGEYSFMRQIQFAYVDGEQKKFVPLFEIAFSKYQDGSFDLGGVNVDCEMEESYIDWQYSRSNSTLLKIRTETFAQEYGILLATVIALVVMGSVLVSQNKEAGEDITRDDPGRTQLLNYSRGGVA